MTMIKMNTKDEDNHRAVLAILGYMHGDAAQIHHVMDEASKDPQGPAGLILALTEIAATSALQSTDAAEPMFRDIALDLAQKIHNQT